MVDLHLAGSDARVEDTSADPVSVFGADEAEQHAESEEPLQAAADDYDIEEALEEEEETATLGGDQFTPEQIAIAEAAFASAQVCCPLPTLGTVSPALEMSLSVHVMAHAWPCLY